MTEPLQHLRITRLGRMAGSHLTGTAQYSIERKQGLGFVR